MERKKFVSTSITSLMYWFQRRYFKLSASYRIPGCDQRKTTYNTSSTQSLKTADYRTFQKKHSKQQGQFIKQFDPLIQGCLNVLSKLNNLIFNFRWQTPGFQNLEKRFRMTSVLDISVQYIIRIQELIQLNIKHILCALCLIKVVSYI